MTDWWIDETPPRGEDDSEILKTLILSVPKSVFDTYKYKTFYHYVVEDKKARIIGLEVVNNTFTGGGFSYYITAEMEY